MRNKKGITLIALIITIIILLILAGISIATLTGENGILTKSSKAKEESLIKQYEEEIKLIIVYEIAERKIQVKKEAFIQSLENKIKEKQWVEATKKCNETETEQTPVENNNRLIVTTKEGYKITIEVDNEKLIANIIDITKSTDEIEEDKTELSLSITNNKITEGSNVSINIIETKGIKNIELKAQDVVIYSEENINAKTYNKTNIGIEQLKNLDQLSFYDDMTVTLEATTINGTKETKTLENVKNYTISTSTQLTALATVVNGGNTLQGETIIQLADIDVNPGKWTPNEDGTTTFANDATQWAVIGTSDYDYDTNTSSSVKAFQGIYNGKNHKIEGVYVNDTNRDAVGLFGYNKGTIKNINLKNSTIQARYLVGGIAGENEGNIENCNNYASVSGANYVGGICSWSNSNLYNNINYGKISDMSVSSWRIEIVGIGGITGWASGQISKCGNYGIINETGVATSYCSVGGIVGEIGNPSINIINSYNLGTISSNSIIDDQSVGGIIGSARGTEGNFTTISQCYNGGDINGKKLTAGIAGWGFYIKIQDCYNTGTIQGEDSIAGIISWTGQQESLSNGSIINCYNVGTVSGSTSYVGGVLANFNEQPILTNCYNLNTSSAYAVGASTGGWGTLDNTWTDHIVTKTEADMKALTGTLGENWENDTNNINAGYPVLKWQLEE